jgi:ribosomal-protein-alanine N-acetyltransferase
MISPDSFPILETSRLILRELVVQDAPSLFAIYADIEHMRWYGIDPFPNCEAAEERIKMFSSMRLQANPATPWAITLKTEGAFIGTCGLFAWNRNWRKCSVGYELARQAQGKGFMQEALRPEPRRGAGAPEQPAIARAAAAPSIRRGRTAA